MEWSKDEINQLKKALENVTSEKVSTLREVEKLRNDNHSLKVTADLQRDIEEKQTKLAKSEETNRKLEEKHEKQKKNIEILLETIARLNKSKEMIETLYTKTRHDLDNSAKIQDEKNLLEEANRKLTDEIERINIQKIELENKVQNAKRALLLPEHGHLMDLYNLNYV